MKHAKRRWVGRLCIGAILLALLLTLPVSATVGYPNNRLVMVTEPGAADGKYVRYFQNGEEKALDALTWVDGGRSGKALLFDGSEQYLTLDFQQLQVQKMTFSAWVYWYGDGASSWTPPESSVPEPPTSSAEEEPTLPILNSAHYGQRLFTFFRGKADSFMTFAMQANDPSRANEAGESLNGPYFGLYRGGSTPLVKEYWQPAGEGESWAIPTGEWHHVAFIADAQTIRVFIDGQLWYSDVLMLSMFELSFAELRLGGNIWGDTPLHAMLDDVLVYDTALTEEQILMLARDVDPQSEGATVPTTAPYIPTAPTTTAPTAPVDVSIPVLKAPTAHLTVFGLPIWSVVVIGVVLALFVLLTIAFAIYDTVTAARTRKGGGPR